MTDKNIRDKVKKSLEDFMKNIGQQFNDEYIMIFTVDEKRFGIILFSLLEIKLNFNQIKII